MKYIAFVTVELLLAVYTPRDCFCKTVTRAHLNVNMSFILLYSFCMADHIFLLRQDSVIGRNFFHTLYYILILMPRNLYSSFCFQKKSSYMLFCLIESNGKARKKIHKSRD